jgi:hypothetical protein
LAELEQHRRARWGRRQIFAHRLLLLLIAILLLNGPTLTRADQDDEEPPPTPLVQATLTPPGSATPAGSGEQMVTATTTRTSLTAGPSTTPAGSATPAPTGATNTPGAAGATVTPDPAGTPTPTVTVSPTRPVPLGGRAYPVPTDQPADYALDGGRFFSQAVPGAPRGFGFSVTDAGGFIFWTEYLRQGGFERLGYPISRRFRELEAWSQAFQGGLLRWRFGANSPELIPPDAAPRLPALAIEPEPPAHLAGEAARKPWSGWWWPATSAVGGPHLFDSNGPLAKYDLYVARNGQDDPRTLEWEQTQLWLDQLAWAGHCNGWAAAALLEDEPTEPREIGPLTFTVGDQKGLLAAYHFADAAAWLYGGDDDELAPLDFHRRLVDWLGIGRKGFILTFRPFQDDEVWSYPVYRFELLMSPARDDASATDVHATLWLADNEVGANFVGLQPWRGQPQVYDYRLFGPPEAPTGGEWSAASAASGFRRPGFIWYPDPDHRNLERTLSSPKLDYRTIKRILKGKA